MLCFHKRFTWSWMQKPTQKKQLNEFVIMAKENFCSVDGGDFGANEWMNEWSSSSIRLSFIEQQSWVDRLFKCLPDNNM